MPSNSAAIVTAVVSAMVSLLVAVLTEASRRRSARKLEELRHDLTVSREATSKAEESSALVARYQNPLLRSAYDLQSRIWNIHSGFSGRRDPEYFRLNTLYVIAEFLGWLEIVRREMQFLDFAREDFTTGFKRRLDDVQDRFASTSSILPDELYIYRGHQRAIGEVMIIRAEGSDRLAPLHTCIGYAAFVRNQQDDHFVKWFQRLGEQVDLLPQQMVERLIEVQHRLIDLIDFLDPDRKRFEAGRSKIVRATGRTT